MPDNAAAPIEPRSARPRLDVDTALMSTVDLTRNIEYKVARDRVNRLIRHAARDAQETRRDEGSAIVAPFEYVRALVTRMSPASIRKAGVLGLAVLGAGALALALFGHGSGPSNLRIHEGDSLARLFDRAEIPDDDLLAVMEAGHGAGVPSRPGAG